MRLNSLRRLWNLAAASALAVLAAVAAAVPELAWAALAAAALALAEARRAHRGDPLAAAVAPRALAIAALVVAATVAAGPTPLLLAGLVLLALVTAEPLLAKVFGASRLETANLAVARAGADRWFAPRPVAAAVSALTAVLALAAAALTAFDAAWAAWTAAAVSLAVAAAIGAGTLRAARRRGGPSRAGDRAVLDAVERLRPQFLVHLAGPPESTFHLRMWLPYFDMLGDPYAIVLRHRDLLGDLASRTEAPIVVAPRITDVENLLTDSVQGVFYVNNSMENAQLVRTGRLTHVQLMHGDSDKLASRNPVSAMYDRIFVAGQAGIDRYRAHGVDLPDAKFRIVGRPQLHGTRVGPRPDAEGAPVVLYTPTWTGTSAEVDYSSLRIGEPIVRGLLDRGATVLLRAHPFTRHDRGAAARLAGLERLLAADAEATGRAHRWGAATAERMSLSECIDAADHAVTDVSGAASDWLYSGKPFALTDMQDLGEALAERLPLAEAAYRIDARAEHLGEALDAMLGDDPLAARRDRVRTYYLGGFAPERAVEPFLDAAREVYRPAGASAAA
ncbi:CDP-glycerol glycerophosphotransferase [Glycomyces paridis]|uniref:CDP-glycerol glycerophosphotransferase n=1 Tax=Glycomyces paridis TaxID=2126555 RepID=A0A4S8PVL5_9ACTN|nr:CDP-glycerol glycerophosphotransferase [Glycomyces paridis]THV31974.1 CDP-glycerol glycerophosphotransferase [Glycomyces paridis]